MLATSVAGGYLGASSAKEQDRALREENQEKTSAVASFLADVPVIQEARDLGGKTKGWVSKPKGAGNAQLSRHDPMTC
jgi:hypothetical protein